ncbi:UAA transporter, partial [Irineochytrium annulatum]
MQLPAKGDRRRASAPPSEFLIQTNGGSGPPGARSAVQATDEDDFFSFGDHNEVVVQSRQPAAMSLSHPASASIHPPAPPPSTAKRLSLDPSVPLLMAHEPKVHTQHHFQKRHTQNHAYHPQSSGNPYGHGPLPSSVSNDDDDDDRPLLPMHMSYHESTGSPTMSPPPVGDNIVADATWKSIRREDRGEDKEKEKVSLLMMDSLSGGANSSNSSDIMSPKGHKGGPRTIWETLDSPTFLVGIYFLLNLSITLYNKIILKLFHFQFPWLLTAIHATISCIGATILVHGLRVVPAARIAKRRDVMIIFLFSFLYTVNIAVSNVSLNLVSLPFHQIVRSTNPAVTLFLERLFLRKRVKSLEVYLSLTLVIAGVALATLGEYEFSSIGLAMTMFGVVLSSLKGILTHKLLVGTLKLHPLDLLWRMSALAAVQCVVVSWSSGEMDAYGKFMAGLRDRGTGGTVSTLQSRSVSEEVDSPGPVGAMGFAAGHV